MRVFDNKIKEHAATYMNRVPLLHCRNPSHEFIFIAFYDEGAGLGAMSVMMWIQGFMLLRIFFIEMVQSDAI